MILLELVEIPLVLEQKHRSIPGISHGFAVEDSPDALQLGPSAVHPSSHLETKRLKPGFNAIFILQSMLHNLELKLADGRKDGITLAFIGVVKDLDSTQSY